MSLRKAIDAKCKECLFDPYGRQGSWRQAVEKCTASSCPLFDVRPRSKVRVGNGTARERSSLVGCESRRLGVIHE